MDDILNAPFEELHPELRAWVQTPADIKWKFLNHPLVQSLPYIPEMNHIYNKQFLYKQRAVQEAIKAEQWSKVVFLHERPYRLTVGFGMVERYLSFSGYWELLGEIWVDSENIWQNLALWKKLLTNKKHYGEELFMNEEERNKHEELPGRVTCYRGAIKGFNEDGLSYTLSQEKAKWFSERFQTASRMPVVKKIRVPVEKVFAYIDRRGEQEIIILP